MTPAPTGGAAPDRAPVLVGTGLEKRFGTAVALAGVDLTLHRGESVAVMGPSGSGKSTLLHCLAGITQPDAGTVWLDGRRIDNLGERSRTRLRRGEFGFVFQSGQLLPELPAAENVALPLMLEGQTRRRGVERARGWLASLGLDGLEHRRPGELSGGQAQRVAIARALVSSPAVVFADEPTAALDQATGLATVELLVGVTREAGAALLVVTHDPGVAALCTRTVHIRDGHLVPHPPSPATRLATGSGSDPAVHLRRQHPDGQVPSDPMTSPSPEATADPMTTPSPEVTADPELTGGRRRRLLRPQVEGETAATTAITPLATADGPNGGTRTTRVEAATLSSSAGRRNGNRRRLLRPQVGAQAATSVAVGTGPGRIRRWLGGGRGETATAAGSGARRSEWAKRSLERQAPAGLTGTSWMTMSWGWPT